MTFVNRLGSSMIGQGVGRSNDALLLKQNIALSGTTLQTNVLPTTGAFSPTISKGKLRIKLTVATGTGVGATVTAVLSDGTNYIQVLTETFAGLGTPGTAAAPGVWDRTRDFLVDINATTLTIGSTLTAGTMTMDVELSGSS